MSGPPPPKSSSPSESMPRTRLSAGTLIAERYQVLEVLGVGSMGTVYAVEHLLLKKKMAVKVLHPELTSVKSLAIRFEREAMATAKIDHPNVVAAVDFGRLADGSLYFALEFIEGRSLRSELSSEAFSISRALHIARQIASLLAAAQPLGIVHRDLKPENVMLVRRGEDPDFAKVLDFGIARMVDPVQVEDGQVQALTKVGAVFGTPEYMAPEQALGQRVDTRADLYSLGVMLFEMIAGTRPYATGDGQAGILAQQITSPRPSFAAAAPHVKVPESVERVVNRLLAKGVGERYQRASDVVLVLENLIAESEESPMAGAKHSSIPTDALPAFELSTHIPGVTDVGASTSESRWRPLKRAAEKFPLLGRLSERVRHRTGTIGSSVRLLGKTTRDRLAARFGPTFSEIPPLVFVAFFTGLSMGLTVAVITWFVVSRRPAVNDGSAGMMSSAEVQGSGTAGAPGAHASGRVQVEPVGTANGALNDPETLIAAMQDKLQQQRETEALSLAVRVLSKHPDRRVDGRVGDVLYRLANSSTKNTSDTAFALLEGTMATKGADILYQLWLDKAVRESARRHAEKWLRGDQFARSASNSLVVTMRLRLADTCEKKRALLPSVAKGGAVPALQYLRELALEKGCGIDGTADCFPCLRGDSRLKDAIAQIEARVSQ